MKLGIQLCIFSIVFFQFMGCSGPVSVKNLPASKELKTAIAGSIKIPFMECDTVIYHSFIGICGNSTKDELNRYFEPRLNQIPYSAILERNYNGKIWFTSNEFYAFIDSICDDENSTWECFLKDKIEFKLTGWVTSNSSVEIYERYFFKGQSHRVNKVFEYENGSWKYRVMKNELAQPEPKLEVDSVDFFAN